MSCEQSNKVRKLELVAFATQLVFEIREKTKSKQLPEAGDLELANKTLNELNEFGLKACSQMLDDAMTKWSGG